METPEAVVEGAELKVWNAVATNVGKSDSGDLHIDITLRNDTGEWSAMHSVPDQPAVLTSDGKTTSCETVFVGTGGHRLAPGFQMHGYTSEQDVKGCYILLSVESKKPRTYVNYVLDISDK